MTVALGARLPTTGSPRRWSARVRSAAAAAPFSVVVHGHGARRQGRVALLLPLPGLPTTTLVWHGRRPTAEPVDGGPIRAAGRRSPFPTVLVAVRELLLTALSLAGVAAVALLAFAQQSGLSTLVVRSGSMEPVIETGAMIVVEEVDAAEIEVGDVLAVPLNGGRTVTHRVIELERRGDAAILTMQGDANEDPDPEPVAVERARRLRHHLPAMGRATAWLASAPGGFVVGSIMTATLGAALRRPDRRPGARGR